MGGEPTMHPRFPEICELYKKYFPKSQRGLFTAGGKFYKKHKDLIDETFGIILYNDHGNVGTHQPILVASEDVIEDQELRNELIDKCWLQTLWSPSITPKGAFFCEVAGTIDNLFDGPGGFPIEPGWWKRSIPECRGQRDEYCRSCSAAIPMEQQPSSFGFDYVSVTNAERLKAASSPLMRDNNYKIFDQKLTRDDITRLRKLKNTNQLPHAHDVHSKDHYWFKCEDKMYYMIYYYDRLLLKLGLN